MEEKRVEVGGVGSEGEIATFEACVESENSGWRDEGWGFVHGDDKVVFAEGFEFIDGADVHGRRATPAAQVKFIVNHQTFLEVLLDA